MAQGANSPKNVCVRLIAALNVEATIAWIFRPWRRFVSILARFFSNEDGVTSIEYAIIASLIGIVIVTSVSDLGGKEEDVFDAVAAGIK